MAHAAYEKRSAAKQSPPGNLHRSTGRQRIAQTSEPADTDAAEGTGFWTKSGVSSQYFVRPCRKRFDLYQLSATPPASQWHHETSGLFEVASITVTRRQRDGR